MQDEENTNSSFLKKRTHPIVPTFSRAFVEISNKKKKAAHEQRVKFVTWLTRLLLAALYRLFLVGQIINEKRTRSTGWLPSTWGSDVITWFVDLVPITMDHCTAERSEIPGNNGANRRLQYDLQRKCFVPSTSINATSFHPYKLPCSTEKKPPKNK